MDKTERAFIWIINILKSREIPFILVGGMAARIYGSTRELHDIDFDIPTEKIKEIIPYVSEYIVFGPGHYFNDVFDLTLLRLSYMGQEIDIGGGTEAKIYDRKKRSWLADETDFSRYDEINVFGAVTPVIKPEDLIEYKSKSLRKEDIIDIKAVKQYLENRY